jgi:uncharacterized protein (DUF1330 family)
MTEQKNESYLAVSNENGAALFARNIPGEVVMLNLLRFRDVADYSDSPDLAPDEPISGRAAYAKYAMNTLPLLEAAGGSLLYSGEGGEFLIGPIGKGWDRVLLVRHQSVAAFMSFASDPDYAAGAGHRTAALADSRLLPLIDS